VQTERATRHAGPVFSDETTGAITRAVFDELAERGYGRLSVDAVARRATVGKAAIYRRWGSKEEMVLSLLADVGTRPELFPDTGGIEGDLRALMLIVAGYLREPLVARIVPDLFAEAARTPPFAAAMHDRIGVVRRGHAAKMMERAIERGELPAELDVALAADVVVAPLYWRLAVTREPFTEQDLERLVGMTLAALRAV